MLSPTRDSGEANKMSNSPLNIISYVSWLQPKNLNCTLSTCIPNLQQCHVNLHFLWHMHDKEYTFCTNTNMRQARFTLPEIGYSRIMLRLLLLQDPLSQYLKVK